MRKHTVVAAALGLLASALLPAAAAEAKRTKPASLPSTAALAWNSIAVNAVRSAVITADGPPRPVLQAEGRVYTAYIQAAVYDAVTKIESRYVPYHDFDADPAGASPEAAVAAAARTTLDYYLPDQAASVDAQYFAYLLTLPNGGKAAGVAVGEAAANDIIALRAGDGRNAPTATYGDPTLPVVAGRWQVVPPATTAATPWLAFMRPFMLESPSQFRSAPPPDLGSKRYADDLNETKAYGAKDSALRSPEQTATAYFWNRTTSTRMSRRFATWPSSTGSIWSTPLDCWRWASSSQPTPRSPAGTPNTTTCSGARTRRSGMRISTVTRRPRLTQAGSRC